METKLTGMILEVVKIRYAIYMAGGMAAKSVVEEVMNKRYGMSMGDARDLSNTVEANQFDQCLVTRRWTLTDTAPTIADYPELKEISPRRHYLRNL